MNFRRTRPKAEVQLNITPMVDVLFNLVFYFMLTSTFIERPLIPIDLPNVDQDARRPDPHEVPIWVSAEGELWMNNEALDEPALRIALKNAARDPDAVVVLRADAAAAHGVVVWLMDLARDAGVQRFAIATESPAKP